MTTSTTRHNFIATTCFDKNQNEVLLLTAQEYPWSVCQIVPTPPDQHDAIIAKLRPTHWIAIADGRKDFIVLHATSGGKGEKHLEVTQANHLEVAQAIQDTMAQAAAYYSKVLNPK